jgi:hypothetical protein
MSAQKMAARKRAAHQMDIRFLSPNLHAFRFAIAWKRSGEILVGENILKHEVPKNSAYIIAKAMFDALEATDEACTVWMDKRGVKATDWVCTVWMNKHEQQNCMLCITVEDGFHKIFIHPDKKDEFMTTTYVYEADSGENNPGDNFKGQWMKVKRGRGE